MLRCFPRISLWVLCYVRDLCASALRSRAFREKKSSSSTDNTLLIRLLKIWLFGSKVVTVKVHTSALSRPESCMLRATSSLVIARAPAHQPFTFKRSRPAPHAWGKCLPPWCVFATVLTMTVNTIVHIESTTTVQVVDAVDEHALLQLPSSTLNRTNGKNVLFHSLCPPSTRSCSFDFFDGSEIGDVFKEVTFHSAMAFNQAHWWTGDVSTPIDGPHAERVGRQCMALADPGASNAFFDLVPASVGDAADAVVNLVQSDGSSNSAVDGTFDAVPVAKSGASKRLSGTGTGAAGGVDEFGEGETAVGGRRTDNNDVLEEAGLTEEEMATEALIDDRIGPAGASSSDTR